MSRSGQSFWFTPNGLAAIALIGAALYFLVTEHRAHFIYALPYLILLLCPLMHIFMHHGNGDHGSHDHDHSGHHHREDE